MDEIIDFISKMDIKTMVLIVIGYAIYIIGRNSTYLFNNRKMEYLIKVIPFLLSLILLASRFINKTHHQSFEGTLIIVLLVGSVISLFNKNNDEEKN